MQPVPIKAFTTGLQTNLKSNIIPDDAFQSMENAFIENAQVKRRLGPRLIDRLRRVFTAQNYGVTATNPELLNLFDDNPTPITDTNREIAPGSVVITIGAPDTATFTDNGNGTFAVTGAGQAANSWVNYATGDVSLGFSAFTGGGSITIAFDYFPGAPVMGIYRREVTGVNQEQTIVFDTTYAYQFDNSTQAFTELATGTTWSGTNADFFWCTNYRGSTGSTRLFFTTNFVNNASNPIRYFDGAWNSFAPLISATDSLFQARFIVPYYGRLLFFNTWEGATIGGAANFFNRCTYSQIGDPTAADAFRRDIFGKGGFVDCPENQTITGVGYYKNTLIVRMERSTWMLRYVGEYGLPFIWEQINSSFGAESFFSSIPLDTGVISVGERGITLANPSQVDRIDEKIKNLVFNISNSNSGPVRVIGAREYQRQLLYWCYADSQTDATFPNRVLVYNYFENNWSIFRDNVTFFGLFQNPTGVLWDSTAIFWQDDATLWDDPDSQPYFPFIASGNQEGYVHYYNNETQLEEQGSLSITDIDRSTTPPQLTIVNHNLVNLELIYLYDLHFVTEAAGTTLSSNFNGAVYQVTVLDDDTVEIDKWDTDEQDYISDYTFTPANGTGTYMGGGQAVLLPVLNLMTKDFNPYQDAGKACKFVKADLNMDTEPNGQFVIRTYSDTSIAGVGNSQLLQEDVQTSAISGYYIPSSEYASHPFYALTAGQFVRLQYTMDNALMSDPDVLEAGWVLNSATLFFRPGGKLAY